MEREKIFPNAINNCFSFLLEIGFSIYDKVECDPNAFGNGYYRFSSDTVGLEIVLDRRQVLVAIGKISQDRRDWLEWSHILKAYARNVKAYDFDLDIGLQVRRISELLQKYCTELLGGDLNNEDLLKEIEDAYGKKFLRRFLQN